MNQIQLEILTGLMLGDGHLEKHKHCKNACLKIVRKRDDKNYLLYHSKIFGETFKNTIKDREIYDKRTNKIYYQSKLATLTNQKLTKLHEKWYINHIKTIPKDLELSPTILATWFADDGCLTIRKGKKAKYDAKLATHGFTFEEVKFLQQKILETFQIEFKIYEDNSGKKKVWTLRLVNKKTLKQFVDVIDPVFPNGMERKSDIWRKNYKLLLPINNPNCKLCGSNRVYKNNWYKGKRLYMCLSCKKRFYDEK